MRSMTRAAFAMLMVGALFVLIGFVLPFWFSRGSSTSNGVFFNIMYAVACVSDTCTSEARIIKESDLGFDTDVQLEAIAALAIVSFVFCLTAVLLALAFQCGLCGQKRSYFYVIMGTFLCTCISVFLNFITIILAAVALADFFDVLNIQNAFEFPWAVLMFGIGGLFMGVSLILYIYILSHWKRYRHIYSRDRYYFETPDGPIFSVEKPDYDRKPYYFSRDSLRRSYAPPRDYKDDRRWGGNYFDFVEKDYRNGYRDDDYRNDYRNGYRERDNYYRKSMRPYDRRYPREYRKSGYYNDKYRDVSRYGATRYDRPWHSKVDDVIDEANFLRMTTGNRHRDRDYYRY